MAETWYDELLDDVDVLVVLMEEIGGQDDVRRPYEGVREELAADRFVQVQWQVRELGHRVHALRQAPADDRILIEVMALLLSLAEYVGTRREIRCTGGLVALVTAFERGSMTMELRVLMGLADPTPICRWK
ncbi:MAG TPA: hypothetical protein VMD91_10535 [Candidatus Sulfotelmatobacter sp.]|nr:hypothetical protein [Candidatus Sulfotelmatobacter sp.]